MARYAFEIYDSEKHSWTCDGVGQQGPSNTLESREEAEAQIIELAEVLGVEEERLRVIEVADDFRAP